MAKAKKEAVAAEATESKGQGRAAERNRSQHGKAASVGYLEFAEGSWQGRSLDLGTRVLR